MADNVPPLTREEWMRRYEARLIEQHNFDAENAATLTAAASYEEAVDGGLGNDPESAADEEISYASDDEEDEGDADDEIDEDDDEDEDDGY